MSSAGGRELEEGAATSPPTLAQLLSNRFFCSEALEEVSNGSSQLKNWVTTRDGRIHLSFVVKMVRELEKNTLGRGMGKEPLPVSAHSICRELCAMGCGPWATDCVCTRRSQRILGNH